MQVAFATPEIIPKRHSYAGLIMVMAMFIIVRMPMMVQQQAGQDEAFFAVPGITVAREGIPRIPYLPARAESSVFFHADTVFNSIPPANSYWQSLFQLVLPDGLLAARIASAVAGLIAILAVYLLGVHLLQCNATGLLAAVLYSTSRLLFFPATSARPDMLCGALGLLAILCMWKWSKSQRLKHLIQTGVLLGFAMLTHFFALVFCLQIAIWAIVASEGKRAKSQNVAIVTITALAVFALWIPLILIDTNASLTQIQNNVFNRAGPGLLTRIFWPWESLTHHTELLIKQAQFPQLILMIAGVFALTQSAIVHYHRSTATLAVLTISSMYLLTTISGVHPANGYWCYPAALMTLCVASSVIRILVYQQWASSSWKIACCLALILATMMPGFGINAWIAHTTGWNDPVRDRERVVRQVLESVPADARLIVDQAIIVDLFIAGRDVVLSSNSDFSIDSRKISSDFLITGPLTRQLGIPADMDTELVTTVGDPDDLFAIWIEVYRIKTK